MRYIYKKTIFCSMAILLIFALGPSALAFQDIADSPHALEISALQEAGILFGEQPEVFNPRGELSYAAGLAMIVRGFGLVAPDADGDHKQAERQPFIHVPEDAWYADAFYIAHAHGLPIPDDVEPWATMTREQFAHLLVSAVETQGPLVLPMIYIMLADEDEVTPEYMSSVQALVIAKWSVLDESQKFHPQAAMTRAEAAAWLYQAKQYVANHPPIHEDKKQESPFYEMRLTVEPIHEHIQQVTVTAVAPHPGYGLRIAAITFEGERAVIHTEAILPDPERMYPQVITEVSATTYVATDYEVELE